MFSVKYNKVFVFNRSWLLVEKQKLELDIARLELRLNATIDDLNAEKANREEWRVQATNLNRSFMGLETDYENQIHEIKGLKANLSLAESKSKMPMACNTSVMRVREKSGVPSGVEGSGSPDVTVEEGEPDDIDESSGDGNDGKKNPPKRKSQRKDDAQHGEGVINWRRIMIAVAIFIVVVGIGALLLWIALTWKRRKPIPSQNKEEVELKTFGSA